MEYLLMAISVLCSVASSVLFRVYSNLNKKGEVSVYIYNAVGTLMWLPILTVVFLNLPGAVWTSEAVIYGFIYGVTLFLYLFFNCKAMTTGPVSLTMMISASCFIVATLFGVIYCKEAITPGQIAGMALMLLVLILCVNPKFSGEKLTKKWFLYALGFFAANGGIGIIYKLFGTTSCGKDYDAMLLVAAVAATVLYLIFAKGEAMKSHKKIVLAKNKILWLMILSGVLTCVYIRLNVMLSNAVPSAVFFPVTSGSNVILCTVVGRFLFGERLSAIQVFGIVLGVCAIVMSGSL